MDATVREISFETPAVGVHAESYPDIIDDDGKEIQLAIDDTGKEIRLWDRSVVPLNATSVTHEDYRPLPVAVPPPSASRPTYSPNPHRLDSRTTTQEAFQAWPVEKQWAEPSPPHYQPSPHKFEARSVTSEDYVPRELPSAPPPGRATYSPNPHKIESRTTNKDAFQAWPLDQPHSPAPAAQYHASPHKFESKSVTQEDYRPLPIEPPAPPASRPVYSPNPHKLQTRTTTHEAYQAIRLPHGVHALGVRTAGGGFHALIPAGTVPPARGQAVFTTTRNGQTEVVIKAVAMGGGARHEMGAFELGGITPTLAGVPQVVVSFEVDAERVLRVSAVDAADKLSMSLTIRHQTLQEPQDIS